MQAHKVIKRNPVVFALAALAAVSLMLISEGSYWQSVGSLAELGAIGEAHSSLQTVQRGVLAAESAQRGYLLTDRKEYVQRYDTAREEVAASVSHLERYYRAAEPAS